MSAANARAARASRARTSSGDATPADRQCNQLGADKYNALADELKLDRAEFQACLAGDKFKAQIEKDMTDAGLAGIGGRRASSSGASSATGGGREGRGRQPFGVFDARLKELLK